MGMEIPLEAIQRQIASALEIIVHLGRLPDKSRKVLEISEVLGLCGRTDFTENIIPVSGGGERP